MALHRVCEEGRVPHAPYPWLYRTVTNLALNHIRDTRTHANKLRRVDGMTVTEISELLGTSRRSVNRTLQ